MRLYGTIDLIMVPIWLLIIYTVAVVIKRLRYARDPTAGYIIPALSIKLAGGVALGLAYELYYGSGDTYSYYLTARSLLLIFLEDFDKGFQLYFANVFNPSFDELNLVLYYNKAGLRLPFWGDRYAYNVSRIIMFANALTLNSYYASTLVMSAFSFTGVWALFRAFYRQYPEIAGRLSFAIFYVPSVFFWGSGILKDPITLGLIGILVYQTYLIVHLRRIRPLSLIILALTSYLLYSIKPYIILSFIPFAALWFGIKIRADLKNPLLRFGFGPLILIIMGIGSYFAIDNIGTGRYSLNQVFYSAMITQKDLTAGYYYSDAKGSTYDIGEFDESFISQLRLLPNSVITTFFRPYLWEIRNSLMLLSSIESTLLFFFTVIIIYRCGIVNIFIATFKRPFLIFCMGFSLAFAFMVGLTSGNFGNLVRYKIPCIPFFISGLLIIDYLIQKNRKERLNFSFSPPRMLPPSDFPPEEK